MDVSILNSIKKLLGLDEEYDVFDMDLIIHINSTFFVLKQLGVGPKQSFAIIDESATWSDFTGETLDIEAVKSYVGLKVRLLFDPPATSFAITSTENLIKEYEWRLNAEVDI